MNKLTEKNVGFTGDFEIISQKTAFSYSSTYKTGMLFGQHVDDEPPRN